MHPGPTTKRKRTPDGGPGRGCSATSIGGSILTSTRHPSRPRVGQRLREALVRGGGSFLAGQQAGESASAVATTAGRGRLDLVMQALQVTTPEALAALVVVSANTYRLPLEETATMAVDHL
jgi:hypothetical protein